MACRAMPFVVRGLSSTFFRQPGCHGFLSVRPVVLRPRLSAGLPFRSVVVSSMVLLI